MVTDRGILTETPAMLAFIVQSFPRRAWRRSMTRLPFAQVEAFNSDLRSTVHVAHAHRMRSQRWADDPAVIAETQRKVPQSVGACFDLIEPEMLKGPWVMGEAYTSCDHICSHWRDGWRVMAWI